MQAEGGWSSRLRRSLFLLPATFCLAVPAATETTIKFATLAPEGSTWMKVMRETAREIQEKTAGRLKFRFYAGGVSGDERDVVRKIRIGQIHAAGFTGLGLGMVAPAVRILDSPFLVGSPEEADLLMTRFEPEFARLFEAQGYVLLGWAEVGLVYLFSAAPIRDLDDLRAAKMWVWEGDAVAEALFKGLAVSPIPLSVADVRASLETGLIDGVYGSPMAVIALQWHPKTPYRHATPVTNASGAALVSKKLFDSLSQADRRTLLEVCRRRLRGLTELGREENRKALETLAAQGVQTIEPASPAVVKAYQEAGERGRRELAGRMYPQALLERVEKALAEHRAARDGRAPK